MNSLKCHVFTILQRMEKEEFKHARSYLTRHFMREMTFVISRRS
jgi:hypothetical protein